MSQNEIEITPSRIAVLDSRDLDSEIFDILKNQLNTIISNLPVEFTYFEPELLAVLKTVLWMLSLQRTSATFGQQLLKIKYSKQTPLRSLRILGFLQIGTSYLKDRLSNILSLIQHESASDVGYKIVEWIEFSANIFNVFYFLKFLKQGGVPTFLENILGLKPVSTVTASSRNIGYYFMTRELIWHGLIEFLVLVIPMVNYHALKRRFKKYIKTPKKNEVVNQDFKDNLKCPICKNIPILPHHMGCSHLYCYYCLLSHRLADKKFECPICGYSNPDASVIPLSLKW